MKQSGSKSHEQEGVHKWQEFRHNAPHTKHALLLGEKNALATSAQHFTTFFGHFIFESFVLYKKKKYLRHHHENSNRLTDFLFFPCYEKD